MKIFTVFSRLVILGGIGLIAISGSSSALAQTGESKPKPRGASPADAPAPSSVLSPVAASTSGVNVTGAPAAAKQGDELRLAPNAPDKYTVVQGDTLWDISAKFLQQPWRWNEIWDVNKDTVADPHWIYPGQVLFLVMTSAGPRLVSGTQIGGSDQKPTGDAGGTQGQGATAGAADTGVFSSAVPGETKLTPRAYTSPVDKAIPSIPQRVIEPFLSQQLVFDPALLEEAPRIVGGNEGHFMMSAGDQIYAVGVEREAPKWDIYRPGRMLTDPLDGAILGQEAEYLGSAQLVEMGTPSVFRVTKARIEIASNDYLIPAAPANVLHYSPHAPPENLDSRVMAIAGGVEAGGPLSVISMVKGSKDGVDVGQVFALYRSTPALENFYKGKRERVSLKDRRYGLVFVFRVFENMSYALVMNANWPVTRGDKLLPP